MPEFLSGQTGIIIVYALFFAGIYFLLIRPNRKKQKAAEEMRNNIQKGDKVVTIGGFTGKVEKVNEEHLILDINGSQLKVKKWAIGQVEEKTK